MKMHDIYDFLDRSGMLRRNALIVDSIRDEIASDTGKYMTYTGGNWSTVSNSADALRDDYWTVSWADDWRDVLSKPRAPIPSDSASYSQSDHQHMPDIDDDELLHILKANQE